MTCVLSICISGKRNKKRRRRIIVAEWERQRMKERKWSLVLLPTISAQSAMPTFTFPVKQIALTGFVVPKTLSFAFSFHPSIFHPSIPNLFHVSSKLHHARVAARIRDKLLQMPSLSPTHHSLSPHRTLSLPPSRPWSCSYSLQDSCLQPCLRWPTLLSFSGAHLLSFLLSFINCTFLRNWFRMVIAESARSSFSVAQAASGVSEPSKIPSSCHPCPCLCCCQFPHSFNFNTCCVPQSIIRNFPLCSSILIKGII